MTSNYCQMYFEYSKLKMQMDLPTIFYLPTTTTTTTTTDDRNYY